MPRVSVIIPTFNRAEYLREALASVFRQTFQDFEVIVVDDGSTDNTADVVASIDDSRIRYFVLEENKGGSAARNVGIRNAKAKYLGFLDDDDEWLENKLELQMQVMGRVRSNVGAVYTGYTVLNKANGRILAQMKPLVKGNLNKKLLEGNCIGTTSTVLVRRECFEKVGFFDESLRSFQDHDMWIRISRQFCFECLPQALVTYHVHGKKIWTDLAAMRQGMDGMLQKYGDSQMFRTNLSYSYLRLGVEFMGAKRTKESRAAFVKAIKLCPLEFRNYFNLALSLFGVNIFLKVKDAKSSVVRRFSKALLAGSSS